MYLYRALSPINMDLDLYSIPSAASNEQGKSTQRAEDQGISTHGADFEGMTAHYQGMTTHTYYVKGMSTHKMNAINVTTLNKIQQNITAMTKVTQQIGETWTSLVGQPSKRYSGSDSEDEMPSMANLDNWLKSNFGVSKFRKNVL